MFDTNDVRRKFRETFANFREVEVRDEYGRPYVPARPVHGLEDIIEVLIDQIEREQRRNRAIISEVEKLRYKIPGIVMEALR